MIGVCRDNTTTSQAWQMPHDSLHVSYASPPKLRRRDVGANVQKALPPVPACIWLQDLLPRRRVESSVHAACIRRHLFIYFGHGFTGHCNILYQKIMKTNPKRYNIGLRMV